MDRINLIDRLKTESRPEVRDAADLDELLGVIQQCRRALWYLDIGALAIQDAERRHSFRHAFQAVSDGLVETERSIAASLYYLVPPRDPLTPDMLRRECAEAVRERTAGAIAHPDGLVGGEA